MGTFSGSLSIALICTYLLAATGASELEATWKGSEAELYQSIYWEPNFGNLIILGDGIESQNKFNLFKELLNESDVFLIQVSCGGEATHGQVCSLLGEHKYVVKLDTTGDSKPAGVNIPVEYKGSDLSYLLQVLLGDQLTTLSSYTELKTQVSQQDVFLVYVVNASSEEYVQLLTVWLAYRLPLLLVTDINVLSLSHRPKYSFSTKPVYLWHIQQSGKQWLRFSYGQRRPPSKQDEPQPSFRENLDSYVDRFRFPIVANYGDAINEELEGTNFHRVLLFPAIGKGLDVNVLAEDVSKAVYTDFIFLIGERDTDIARRLFVTDDKKNPQAVILPFGNEEDQFALEIETDNMKTESDQLRDILRSFAHDTPRTGDPEDSHKPPLVTVLDTVFFHGIVKEKRTEDVLAAFCVKGVENCPGVAYEALRNLMVALEREGVLKELGSLVAHVVECDSVDDITTYGFKSLPAYGLYNHTRDKWFRSEKELTKPFQAMALIILSSGLDGLISLDLSSADQYTDDYYSPDHHYDEEYSTPQTEDDHFGLLLKTLPVARLPKDSTLTSDNFDDHILKFKRTVVVFYMSWCVRSQLFLNHVVAAYKFLDTAAAHNVSLSVVNCEDWTDLCTRVGVTTFPTALLFTPDTLHTPTPLPHLDTPHILNALGQHPLESDNEEELLELTPSTLPSLLGGNLATPLVVWCDSHVTSDKREAFRQVAQGSKGHSEWSFAWIDSSKHAELLLKMTHIRDLVFPTVLVLKLAKHEVYQFPVTEDQTGQEFSEGLEIFLAAVASGDTKPLATLEERSWPPVQPPVKFPSEDWDETIDERGRQETEGAERSPDQKALPSTKEAPPTSDQFNNQPPPHQSSHTEL